MTGPLAIRSETDATREQPVYARPAIGGLAGHSSEFAPMSTCLEAAADCLARGLAPIPLPHGQKRAVLDNWPNLRIADAELERYFGRPCNIGVLTGEASSGLVDVDLDHPLAVELADLYLPSTASVYGREGKPKSHRLYRVAGGPCRTSQFRTADELPQMIVELRGDGLQSMWPGSVHPNGETVRWDEDGEPASLDLKALRDRVAALANAVRARLGQPSLGDLELAGSNGDVLVTCVAGTPDDSPVVITRASRYLAAMPPAISGQDGHSRTYAAAVVLVHGFGLSPNAAYQLLWSEYNPRCQPPWSERELTHKITDAATKAHARPYRWLRDDAEPKRAATVHSKPDLAFGECLKTGIGDGGHLVQPAATPCDPPIISAVELLRKFPSLRPPVIDALLRVGETMNVIAAPKTGKSWLVHDMMVAVGTGQPWFGRETLQGRVLLIDAELHRETLAFRLERAFRNRDLDPMTAAATVDVWSARGTRTSIDAILAMVQAIPRGTYRLIVIDALYRVLPEGTEENANDGMTHVYNTVDAIAEHSQAAVVLVHHASKGNQSKKDVTDIGAGAGAQSRAADTHLVLRQHEEADAVVVDAAVRSWKPFESFVIRWTGTAWVTDSDLDPGKLRPAGSRAPKAAPSQCPPPTPKAAMTPLEFATKIVGESDRILEDVLADATAAGLKRSEAERLLKRAVDQEVVFKFQPDCCKPFRYSTKSQLSPPLGPQGGKGGVVPHPHPPERCAPGGVWGGTDTHPPLPPAAAPSTVDRSPPTPKRARRSPKTPRSR